MTLYSFDRYHLLFGLSPVFRQERVQVAGRLFVRL